VSIIIKKLKKKANKLEILFQFIFTAIKIPQGNHVNLSIYNLKG
jgi:hypothetical protein